MKLTETFVYKNFPFVRRLACVFDDQEMALIIPEVEKLIKHLQTLDGPDELERQIKRLHNNALSMPKTFDFGRTPQGFAFWAGLNKTYRIRWSCAPGKWAQFQLWDIRNHEKLLNQ